MRVKTLFQVPVADVVESFRDIDEDHGAIGFVRLGLSEAGVDQSCVNLAARHSGNKTSLTRAEVHLLAKTLVEDAFDDAT